MSMRVTRFYFNSKYKMLSDCDNYGNFALCVLQGKEPKPKAIKKATELKKIQIESQRRKLQNMLKHNKKTTVIQSEKEKAVGNTLK